MSLLQQQNGRCRAGQHFCFLPAHMAEFPRRHQVRHHHRQGFVWARFSPPEPQHRLFPGGVHQELIPAQPLQRQHFSPPKHFHRGDQRLLTPGSRYSLPVHQPDPGAALRAGHRLSVVAAVQGVVVFCPAGVAEGEGGHRGVLAVIGQAVQDGVARAAVGAVDEGVAVTAVDRVQELPPALVAYRQVGQHEGPLLPPFARGDVETHLAPGCQLAPGVLFHDRVGGRLRHHALEHLFDGCRPPLNLQQHASGIVGHPAGQFQLPRQAVERGAVAHPLDCTPDTCPHPACPLPHAYATPGECRWTRSHSTSSSNPCPVRAESVSSGASGLSLARSAFPRSRSKSV